MESKHNKCENGENNQVPKDNIKACTKRRGSDFTVSTPQNENDSKNNPPTVDDDKDVSARDECQDEDQVDKIIWVGTRKGRWIDLNLEEGEASSQTEAALEEPIEGTGQCGSVENKDEVELEASSVGIGENEDQPPEQQAAESTENCANEANNDQTEEIKDQSAPVDNDKGTDNEKPSIEDQGSTNDELKTNDIKEEESNLDDGECEIAVGMQKGANRSDHHTSMYNLDELICRRGQPINMLLHLSQRIDLDVDLIKVKLETGENPLPSKGTRIRLAAGRGAPDTVEDWSSWVEDVVEDDVDGFFWKKKVPKVESVEMKEFTGSTELAQEATEGHTVVEDPKETQNAKPEGYTLKIGILPACDAIIGIYTVTIELYKVNSKGVQIRSQHICEKPLYIIFNPWCEDDAVYMENEVERQEYVLNETGRIYKGNVDSIRALPWNYGQFSSACLEAALYVLDSSYLSKSAQSNPTQVTRCISSKVNSCDNDGVLEGNWSGKYSLGTSPSDWCGSDAILEEFVSTKKPVKYGQCWVFSGVATTLCRALGIPTRSVTNFKSAHDGKDPDGDYSMTIDKHITVEGRPSKQYHDDSVWNFHVWNESWFKRPDLPRGNDGWQAFDATPQESSKGMKRCGPAPVAAIKEGNVFLSYDAKFIFAEVNGDRITWQVADNGDMLAVNIDKHTVGQFISTKAPGSNERLDITNLYKYEEGSLDERRAVERASQHSSRQRQLKAIYNLLEKSDVHFSYNGRIESNGDITVKLTCTNKSAEQRTVEVNIFGMARYYTGVPGEDLYERHYSIILGPGASEESVWTVEGVMYLNKLDEDASLGVYIMATVKETGQIYTHDDTLEVDMPALDIKTSTSCPKVASDFTVDILFTNPLGIALTDCSLCVEGPGIAKQTRLQLGQDIVPGQTLSQSISLTPKYAGPREVIVHLHSHQVAGIAGAAFVTVKESD